MNEAGPGLDVPPPVPPRLAKLVLERATPLPPPPPPVETRHTLRVDGRALSYTATTGLLPLKNEEKDEIELKGESGPTDCEQTSR